MEISSINQTTQKLSFAHSKDLYKNITMSNIQLASYTLKNKTITKKYLILYGLEPSSDPKPENDPSKSAARPPSMSSALI